MTTVHPLPTVLPTFEKPADKPRRPNENTKKDRGSQYQEPSLEDIQKRGKEQQQLHPQPSGRRVEIDK